MIAVEITMGTADHQPLPREFKKSLAYFCLESGLAVKLDSDHGSDTVVITADKCEIKEVDHQGGPADDGFQKTKITFSPEENYGRIFAILALAVQDSNFESYNKENPQGISVGKFVQFAVSKFIFMSLRGIVENSVECINLDDEFAVPKEEFLFYYELYKEHLSATEEC